MYEALRAEYIRIYESIVITFFLRRIYLDLQIKFFLRLKIHKIGACVPRFYIENLFFSPIDCMYQEEVPGSNPGRAGYLSSWL